MVDTIPIDPLSELKKKANELITVEDTLYIISKKLGCSRVYAAEIILSKLPDEKDGNGHSINPSFFGRKVGIATFSHCDDRPLIRKMLLSIIEGDSYAFEESEAPIDFDDDIPF